MPHLRQLRRPDPACSNPPCWRLLVRLYWHLRPLHLRHPPWLHPGRCAPRQALSGTLPQSQGPVRRRPLRGLHPQHCGLHTHKNSERALLEKLFSRFTSFARTHKLQLSSAVPVARCEAGHGALGRAGHPTLETHGHFHPQGVNVFVHLTRGFFDFAASIAAARTGRHQDDAGQLHLRFRSL